MLAIYEYLYIGQVNISDSSKLKIYTCTCRSFAMWTTFIIKLVSHIHSLAELFVYKSGRGTHASKKFNS